MSSPPNSKLQIPHLTALVAAILAAVAGCATVVFGKLEPAQAKLVAEITKILVGGALGSHGLAIFGQARTAAATIAAAAAPMV